jgi:endonuclease/exonuclease/phosphatase (EEP) superfamily protein YafD
LWIRRGVAAVILLTAALHILSRVLPANLCPESALWISFMVRTLTLHSGLALLLLWPMARRLGARRTSWAALAVSLWLLVPTLLLAWPRSEADHGPRFSLASFNIWGYRNERLDAAAESITRCGADVVCIQEYTPNFHRTFGTKLAEHYPHRIVDAQDGFFGSAIYSRLPLHTAADNVLPGELGRYTEGTIRLGGRSITLFNVHLWHNGPGQRRQVQAILDKAASRASPQIWVGDFNFTQYSRAADHLAEAGFRDALDLAGAGIKTTWPINRRGALLLYPGFRIDHVYLSAELSASMARVADLPGADHKQIYAELGFTKQPR